VIILTYLLSCTVSKLRLIIGKIFASERGVPHLNAIAWGSRSPANIAVNDISLKTTFFGLRTFLPQKVSVYLQPLFYAICPERYRIPWNYAAFRPITPFNVIQGHRVWYQSIAHMRLHFLLVINSNLPPILHRFRDIALERSKIATFSYPSLVQPPDGGVPLGRSR